MRYSVWITDKKVSVAVYQDKGGALYTSDGRTAEETVKSIPVEDREQLGNKLADLLVAIRNREA
jgi:hypothetical protein